MDINLLQIDAYQAEALMWIWIHSCLIVLDGIAMGMVALHLALRYREFTFEQHGVSLGFLVYVTGHLINRVIYVRAWTHILYNPLQTTYTERVVSIIFNHGILFVAVALAVAGLLVIIRVMAETMRPVWWVASIGAALLATLWTIVTTMSTPLV